MNKLFWNALAHAVLVLVMICLGIWGATAAIREAKRQATEMDSAPAPEAAPIPDPWPSEPPPLSEPLDMLKDGQIRIWRPGHWETYTPAEQTIFPPKPDRQIRADERRPGESMNDWVMRRVRERRAEREAKAQESLQPEPSA